MERKRGRKRTYKDICNQKNPLELCPFHFFLASAVAVHHDTVVVVIVPAPHARFATSESPHASSLFWERQGIAFPFPSVRARTGRQQSRGEFGRDIVHSQGRASRRTGTRQEGLGGEGRGRWVKAHICKHVLGRRGGDGSRRRMGNTIIRVTANC